jgi:cellulose synthase/poly-beta-1,6-N-acetylglucosamine synthase-like glycosyltransferase
VLVVSFWQIIQLIGSLIIVYSNKRKEYLFGVDSLRKTPELIPISIIAPAYNEGPVIVDSVKGMLNLNYPVYEVVVVNDGSSDDSLEKLIKEFNLRKISYPIQRQVQCAKIRGVYRNPKIPKLTVIDKENGGAKADACNAGINASRYPYFINMDSDCLLDRDSLDWVARVFMNNKDCVAVGGMMRMSNGNEIKDYTVTNFRMPKNWWARFQVLEYSRAFLVGRTFNSQLGCLMVISGAFGAFHKASVIEVGGYSLDTIGEDMDLVMKLHAYMKENKRKYSIVFAPNAICWTQGPETYKELRGQRRRWHAGLMQVMSKFKRLLLNPRYGTVGFIGMPYQFVYELWGPVIELLGLIAMPLSFYLGIITPYGFLLFCTGGLLLGILVSIGAIAVDMAVFNRKVQFKDFLQLAFLALLDNFFYHFVNVVFRLQALFGKRKYKHRWEKITRTSFKDTK